MTSPFADLVPQQHQADPFADLRPAASTPNPFGDLIPAKRVTDYPVLGPEMAGAARTFAPDATAVAGRRVLPQPSIRAASSLDAANQIPKPVTPVDRALGGEAGYPLVDNATNVLMGRGKAARTLSVLPPVFLAQQGAQAGQAAGQGRYGEAAVRLGTAGALALGGEAMGGALGRAGAPVAEDAARVAQNPTLPEALSPTINETLQPSGAAAAVRRSLVQRAPVAASRPADPVALFNHWSDAAEDASLSPALRAHAAQQADAVRPAAEAVYAARAATPFPGEPGAPPVPPEPVEPEATFPSAGMQPTRPAWQMTRDEFNNAVWYHGAGTADVARLGEAGNLLPFRDRMSTYVTLDPLYAAKYPAPFLSNRPPGAVVALLPEGEAASWNDPSPESVRSGAADNVERAATVTSIEDSRDMRVAAIIPRDAAADPHRYIIKQALAAGKPVPPHVLAEYPDLASDATFGITPPEEPRPEGFAFSEPLGKEPTADELQYRFGGLGVLPQQAENIADVQRSALTSPFSKATREYPRVAEKANQVGAARHYANWLATRGVQFANEGLTPEQVGQFYNRLVVDNLEAVNPESPALAYHRAQYPPGVENEPWFKTALDNYQTNIESKIEPYAEQSGVGQSQMRRPSLGAYVKLLAVDPETGAPYSAQSPGGGVPKNLSPRVLKTISAQQATGSAARYSVDPQAIVASQGEKIVKGARNQLIDVAKETGRPIGPKELVMPNEGIIVREHSRPVETATGETVPVLTRQRYAVPKSVSDAVAHVQKQLATGATTPYAQAKLPRLMTGASLEFSPAAAPYHMASLTAKVGNVPGTGVLDELPAALPILGKRAQGIARVVAGVDFADPETRAMEGRLAKIGALRPSDAERRTILSRVPGVGKVTQGLHDLLFGPQGVDVRTRIWLGKRYLAEHPNATDDQIRKFVTDLAGNYVRENSGDLINAAQDLGLTAYARFSIPSIKTGITQNLGISGLGNRPGLVARQLARGAAGTVVGIELLNRALSGHGPESNNAGHRFDIDVTPEANFVRRAIGKANSPVPIYAKISALDPGFSRAARATGVDALANGGDAADAARQFGNTVGFGLLSPAARFGFTATTGFQPYFTNAGAIPVQPVAPGQSRFMANLKGAASGAAGSLEAAFGGGSPNAKPFGGFSTAMNLALPQLLTSGSGLSPAEAAARDRYFQMKDYKAAQRRNARQRAMQ